MEMYVCIMSRPGHKMLEVLSKVAPILVKSCLKVATFSEKLPKSCQFCQKLPRSCPHFRII